MAAVWAPIVFWILLVPLLIVMLIVYLRSRQFFRLVYILSVFTYAMTIMYWIDAYRLGRNAIVGLLVVSSLLMIGLGFIMRKKTVQTTRGKNVGIAVACLVLIAIIVTLSALPIGWQITKQAAQSVMLKEVHRVIEEGQPDYGPGPGVPIYSISVTSTFIPRQFELPNTQACLYNTQLRRGIDVGTEWDVREKYSEFGAGMRTMEVFKDTKTATLRVMPYTRWKPVPAIAREKVPAPPVPEEIEVFDQLLLFIHEDRQYDYVNCYNILPTDFQKAMAISVLQN